MTYHPDRDRIRPTVDGRARLLAALEMVGPPHVVDAGTLGEYAVLVADLGRPGADARMPEVASHLADGCQPCSDDLRELSGLIGVPDATSSVGPPAVTGLSSASVLPPVSELRPDTGLPSVSGLPPAIEPAPASASEPRSLVDSGIHAAGLPDPRAAEAAEAARRQRLRKLRDWLLVASAISILLIGLSLVGMAYLANSQPGPARIGLTPLPVASPGASGPGRAAPSGMACPASHPLKGNRSSMIYHQPGAEFYDQTRPEDCFASPADAEAAGYRASLR